MNKIEFTITEAQSITNAIFAEIEANHYAGIDCVNQNNQKAVIAAIIRSLYAIRHDMTMKSKSNEKIAKSFHLKTETIQMLSSYCSYRRLSISDTLSNLIADSFIQINNLGSSLYPAVKEPEKTYAKKTYRITRKSLDMLITLCTENHWELGLTLQSMIEQFISYNTTEGGNTYDDNQGKNQTVNR